MVNVDDDDDMVCEGTLMYPFGVVVLKAYYKLSCFSKALLPLLHA